MNAIAKGLFELISSWPEEDQLELAEVAREIEARRTGEYAPTAPELAAIDRGIADADAGRIATEDQIEAILSKFRNA